MVASYPPSKAMRPTCLKSQTGPFLWVQFWVSCFKEGKIVPNYQEIFNHPAVIDKFFAKCSSVRDNAEISSIGQVLNIYSNLELSTSFEISSDSDYFSVGRSIMQRIFS